MTPLTGSQTKKRLCDAVASATAAKFEPDEKAVIPADLIRRLVLRRPLARESAVRMLTPFGIRIAGATIDKRLDLDNATPLEGGPLCPLEFHDCELNGGFSGAHARFSRLSFRKCRFVDTPPDREGHVPSINLPGSSIGTDLDLREVKPASDGNYLWIRLAGAWIDGEVDLSCSVLKAPPARPQQLASQPSSDALDLSLAEVRGDFQFMNGGRCSGRINMRGVHITGDVWISGARLDAPGKECIFLQSATIGGNLVLDGRPARYDESGDIERLQAVGEIHLLEIKLSGSLDINNVDLEPGPADAHSRPGDAGVCVCLVGARIGGPVTIGSRDPKKAGSAPAEKSRINGRLLLDGMEVSSSITFQNVQLGLKTDDPESPAVISARSLVARRVEMNGIEPLLWSGGSAEWLNPPPRLLSVNFDGARVERLKIHASRFSGYLRARPLTCARDVTLDVWIGDDVDLKGSDIGGSLDISELRADGGLGLRDAGIGRALKFKRPPGPKERKLEGLVKARLTKLKCLPDTSLIETLWRYQSGSDKALVCQVAFLQRRGLVRALDKPEALDDFVKSQGHTVASEEAAEEYVRLMTAYAGKAEERSWIVSGRNRLPPFVEAEPAPPTPPIPETDAGAAQAETPAGEPPATQAAVEAPAGTAPAATATGDAAGGAARSDPPLSLEALPVDLFKVVPRSQSGKYEIEACFLRGARLSREVFRVTPAEGRVVIEPLSGEPVGPPLRNLPVAHRLYTYHPSIDREQLDHWVIPPVVGRRNVKPKRLAELETLLLPYVQPGSSIRGKVDLTDLSCDTLDDGGGRFWGKDLKFKLDRFVYRQATWVDDVRDIGFRVWLRRHVNRIIAERAPLRLIDRYGWRQTRLQLGDFWAPWQIRRNWIYQQFDLDANLPSPTRHQIQQSEYRPQPFEQAIRVSLSEGRQDFAANFEILKRRIEWSLFSRRSRRPLLVIGILASLAWLVIMGGPPVAVVAAMAGLLALVFFATRPRAPNRPLAGWVVRALLVGGIFATTVAWLAWQEGEPWERARNFAVAVLILGGLRCVSSASDWLMRNLFGYLRLPINAIVSLIIAFLVGWAAVDLANDRKMLVIDVEPVASLVARDSGDQKVYVGAQRGTSGARMVHCGDEIDEPLYALDVLIPLIDLRQEIRCEVGRALPFDERDPAGPPRPVAYVVELLLGSILDSEEFWAAAKALYAIAGWFLVSLSILTFANANRPRGEPPAT